MPNLLSYHQELYRKTAGHCHRWFLGKVWTKEWYSSLACSRARFHVLYTSTRASIYSTRVARLRTETLIFFWYYCFQCLDRRRTLSEIEWYYYHDNQIEWTVVAPEMLSQELDLLLAKPCSRVVCLVSEFTALSPSTFMTWSIPRHEKKVPEIRIFIDD